MNQIEIYQTKDKQTEIEVNFEEGTVWLTQDQMTRLFGRDRTVITKHINNVFKEEELDKKSNVQKMHIPKSDKPVAAYSLDVVISVGYRVKSKWGTHFRQWATQRLKDHLIKGYTLNEKRLRQVVQNMQQLQQPVKHIQQSGNSEQLSNVEVKGLLEIITNYTQSFILLNRFDRNDLATGKRNKNISYEIEYREGICLLRLP